MNAKFALLTLSTLLLIGCHLAVDDSDIDDLVAIGDFLLQATEKYEELADKFRAKALVSVANLLDRPLRRCNLIQTKGITESPVPVTVKSGYEEGFLVRQNNPGQGVDMIFTFRVRFENQTLITMVHFGIDQQVAGRKPNRLGLTVVTNEEYNYYSSFPTVSSGSKRFTEPLQCAAADFAVQATMATNHQSNITITVYPKSINNFAANMAPGLSDIANLQEELDEDLDYPQSCLTIQDSAGAHVSISSAIAICVFAGYLIV